MRLAPAICGEVAGCARREEAGEAVGKAGARESSGRDSATPAPVSEPESTPAQLQPSEAEALEAEAARGSTSSNE